MIYLCQMQQLHTPDFLERSFGYTAPIPDLIWDHVLCDRISRCTKTQVYIYIYWSLTFLSLSRKLDMYPKSDVLSSSVRLKHYIFKRLYIIFTHTHLYIPSMLFERKSKKLFLLDSYGVPPKKTSLVVSGRSGSSRNPRCGVAGPFTSSSGLHMV